MNPSRVCLAFVVAGACASAAHAGSLTRSVTVSGLTDLFATAQLEQFDPALGTLDSIEFTVDAFVEGSFTFTNIAGAAKRVRVDYVDWSVNVSGFGGPLGNLLNVPWVTPPTPEEPFGGPPGQWNLPRTGLIDVGVTLGPLPYGGVYNFNTTYTSADAFYSAFIGTGTIPIDIAVPVLFGFSVTGTGNYTAVLSTSAGMTVTATYNYTIPAPASAAMLVLAGAIASRRRRS